MTEPFPVVTLADVLTAEELAAQPFAADTILNDPWRMPEALGRYFAQWPNNERRHYVRASIEIAQVEHWELTDTLRVLLTWDAAPPPKSYMDPHGGNTT